MHFVHRPFPLLHFCSLAVLLLHWTQYRRAPQKPLNIVSDAAATARPQKHRREKTAGCLFVSDPRSFKPSTIGCIDSPSSPWFKESAVAYFQPRLSAGNRKGDHDGRDRTSADNLLRSYNFERTALAGTPDFHIDGSNVGHNITGCVVLVQGLPSSPCMWCAVTFFYV